jgi:hypothetical protein
MIVIGTLSPEQGPDKGRHLALHLYFAGVKPVNKVD